VKRAALVLGAAMLAACAHAPAPEDAPKTRPLTSYAGDPFVPVNLYFNANESALGQKAELIDYAARQLRESKAFVRVDRGVQRWPITLQATYRLERGGGEGDTLRNVVLALTLGLVPVRITARHQLTVEIFEEPETTGMVDLTLVSSDRASIYDVLSESQVDERAAVDILLERLMAEIAQRKMVPRWKDFKPEPKNKKKPEGRAT
jgi:hypothetical protein